MDMKLIIQGINYYARKEKMYGLDEREAALRQELRDNYINLIRLSFQDQIKNIIRERRRFHVLLPSHAFPSGQGQGVDSELR